MAEVTEAVNTAYAANVATTITAMRGSNDFQSTPHTSTISTKVGRKVKSTARNTMLTERVPRSMILERAPVRRSRWKRTSMESTCRRVWRATRRPAACGMGAKMTFLISLPTPLTTLATPMRSTHRAAIWGPAVLYESMAFLRSTGAARPAPLDTMSMIMLAMMRSLRVASPEAMRSTYGSTATMEAFLGVGGRGSGGFHSSGETTSLSEEPSFHMLGPLSSPLSTLAVSAVPALAATVLLRGAANQGRFFLAPPSTPQVPACSPAT
mmetsp:Transcript_71648/g.226363  ORF Transcript_71648/g.226363 Transcript_71648/m.226363 type:complete len:267 (-) Transcript_71648:263-1063(-)